MGGSSSPRMPAMAWSSTPDVVTEAVFQVVEAVRDRVLGRRPPHPRSPHPSRKGTHTPSEKRISWHLRRRHARPPEKSPPSEPTPVRTLRMSTAPRSGILLKKDHEHHPQESLHGRTTL